VIDHSLLGQDFRRGQLPRGPRGPRGGKGPMGLHGPTGPEGRAALEGVTAGGDLSGSYPNPTLRAGAITRDKLAPPTDWRDVLPQGTLGYGYPVFEFGWHNAGDPYSTAGFYVDALSVVHLKGVIAGGAAGPAFYIFGAAPNDRKTHVFLASSGDGIAKLEVTFNGGCGGLPEGGPLTCSYYANVVVSSGAPGPVSLDGIAWRVCDQGPSWGVECR